LQKNMNDFVDESAPYLQKRMAPAPVKLFGLGKMTFYLWSLSTLSLSTKSKPST